jgi:P27 family predicted phage terminase small subunit
MSDKVAQIFNNASKPGKKPGANLHKAPKHLRPATKRWYEQICADYELESHHLMLLTLCAEAWDRHLQAREALSEHGTTFSNKHGDVKARPEVMIERDSRNAFARMLREINLDVEPPETPRPPGLKY